MKIKILLIVFFAALFVWLLFVFAKEAKSKTAAIDAYNRGDFVKASEIFKEAFAKEPENAELGKNAAAAAYKKGDTKEAGQIYKRLLETLSLDRENRAAVLYNLGNAEFRNNRYEEAVKMYMESLKINPSDKDAKTNLEIAFGLLKQKNKRQNSQDAKKKLEKNKQMQRENKEESENEKERESAARQKEEQSRREKENAEKNAESARERIAGENDPEKKKELEREHDSQREAARDAAGRQQESAKEQKEARKRRSELEKEMNVLQNEQGKLEKELQEAEKREKKNFSAASGEKGASSQDENAGPENIEERIKDSARREAQAVKDNEELRKELAAAQTRERELADELRKLNNESAGSDAKKQKEELNGAMEKQKERKLGLQKRIDENNDKIERERRSRSALRQEKEKRRGENARLQNEAFAGKQESANNNQNYANIDTILNYYKEEDKKSDRLRHKNVKPVIENAEEDW